MKDKFALLAALSALFVLIFASNEVIASSRYALSICAELILPSLFPFFVLSILLAKMGLPRYIDKLCGAAASRLFSVSGAGISALFIGLSGGYPMGAAYIVQMYESNNIDKDEAERLLAFCNNSGPAFIIGAVGAGVFASVKTGILLYAVHIFSAIITGIIFRKKKICRVSPTEHIAAVSFTKAFPEAVKQAVMAALNVCGFVVCFTVFVGLLDANGFLSALSDSLSAISGFDVHWIRSLFCGLLEIGSAAACMRGLSPSPLNISLAAAILAWGGVSVHFQTLALISDTDIKGTLHFAGRLLGAVLSAVSAYVLAILLG